MKITQAALDRRTAVFVLIFLIVLGGVLSYYTLPREAAPEIQIPIVLVVTTNRGVSPEDIEWNITDKIETQMQGLSGVKEIRSTSAEGASMVVIEFYPDVDIDDALQKVRDRVTLAKGDNWPSEADEPLVKEINLAEIPVIYINLFGSLDPVALKEVGDELADALEAVPGVLDVTVTGGRTREITVEADPDRLQAYRVPLSAVLNLVRNENTTVSAGALDLDPAKVQVRVPAEFQSREEIERVGITVGGGAVVHVRDLATVDPLGFEDDTTYSRLNGQSSVTLAVQKRSGANIIAMLAQVKALVDQARARFPPGVNEPVYTFDMSREIGLMIEDLENSVLTGFFFVLVVVWLFLGFRTSLFVASAIPLSLLITFIVVSLMGMTLNMVVLFSLIMAVGMLVDNAVVIVENIYRHMSLGKSAETAAVEAVQEVGWPVVTSTLTTLAAFAPLLFWPDTIGKFLGFLPKTLIAALTASLFVALVINPVLCAAFMRWRPPAGGPPRATASGTPLNRVTEWYRRWLERALARPQLVIAGSFLLLVAVIAVFVRLDRGTKFLPDVDPAMAFVDIRAAEGTSLQETDRLARQIEERLFAYLPGKEKGPDVRYVIADVGTAGSGEVNFGGGGGQNSHRGRVAIDFVDFEERERSSFATFGEIRDSVPAGLTGADIQVRAQGMGPPQAEYPINIELSGDDFAQLAELAQRVRREIRGVPGLVDVQDDYVRGKPELRPIPDREVMALFNISAGALADHVQAAVDGVKVGVWREGDDEYDIRVRYPPERRHRLDSLFNLMVSDPQGNQVPLSTLARLEYRPGLGVVRRVDGRRTVTVHGNVQTERDFNAQAVLQDVQARLEPLAGEVPAGVLVNYRGEQEDIEHAQKFLLKAFFITVGLIAMILILQFNSVTLPLIIICSVFLSLIGVFMHLVVTRNPFIVIMTGMGVISLAGVVVNNAIILIDYIEQLKARGLARYQAVVEGGMTRLRPVLLTATTTILGLVPMGLHFSIQIHRWPPRPLFGTESAMWWGPMASAVIFGLAVATGLTLVVLPCLYLVIDRWRDIVRDWWARIQREAG